MNDPERQIKGCCTSNCNKQEVIEYIEELKAKNQLLISAMENYTRTINDPYAGFVTRLKARDRLTDTIQQCKEN